jgi:hypothetical protein
VRFRTDGRQAKNLSIYGKEWWSTRREKQEEGEEVNKCVKSYGS